MLPGQAQKEFFVNEAHAIIDSLLHLTIEAERDTPPSSQQVGQCWIVGNAPTDDWVGHEAKIATFIDHGWKFTDPLVGMYAFDISNNQLKLFNGSWMAAQTVSSPQGGDTVDIEARAAIGELVVALRTLGLLSQ